MKPQIKQYEVLKWASLFLKENNREPEIAEILLQHHLQVSRSQFYMMMREPISETLIDSFQADVKKHVMTGIPVQHLTGYEMFYGRQFSVNKAVLIPRPETEELVQHVIKIAEQRINQNPITIVDIGTGSGIIATTLALEINNAFVYATDISKNALDIAEENAERLQANVTFLQGDFLQPLVNQNRKVDIIVSNPPYIAESEEASLSDTVKNFDPQLALFADGNGLAAYKSIIKQVPKVANPYSSLIFETGENQGDAVCKLIKESFSMCEVEVIQDINGKDRIVSAKI